MLIISNCKRVGSIVSKSKDTHMATYERSSNLQKGLMGPNIILSRNPLSHNPIIMQHCMWSQKCSFKFHGTHSNSLSTIKHTLLKFHIFFLFWLIKRKPSKTTPIKLHTYFRISLQHVSYLVKDYIFS
jgi:hypothetical protein